MSGLAALLADARVCVVGGSGGVGKTTTSAALAAGMAARGLRVAVVTIDPAQRLATALGLDELGNEPHRIEPERFAAAGLPLGDGELWAMTLDPKRTFDELIARLSPDADTREQILANRVYRELSDAIAGSQEFTAVAKLHELAQEGDWDLLVLDTPPSRNALDFLDAPDRLRAFFEGRALQTLLRGGGAGLRLIGRGTGLVLGLLQRVTGAELLSDLSDFFRLLGGPARRLPRARRAGRGAAARARDDVPARHLARARADRRGAVLPAAAACGAAWRSAARSSTAYTSTSWAATDGVARRPAGAARREAGLSPALAKQRRRRVRRRACARAPRHGERRAPARAPRRRRAAPARPAVGRRRARRRRARAACRASCSPTARS